MIYLIKLFLDVFKFDEKYEENEGKYKTLSKEILQGDSDSDSESGSGSEEEEDSGDDEEETSELHKIIDNTETNLIALRRTIYLTIQSSLDYEECAHKLLKMELKPGQEIELCHMFLGKLFMSICQFFFNEYTGYISYPQISSFI